MNFEVIDNAIQVSLLFCCMLFCVYCTVRTHKREYLLLTGVYGCMAMGTLYYLLYLIVIGTVPQIFCVSEIAWIASYLFMLVLMLKHQEQYKKIFSLPACLLAVWFGMTSFWFSVLGPSRVLMLCYAIVAALIFYHGFAAIFQKKVRQLDLHLIAAVCLQFCLYRISVYMDGFTRFNLYFLVDFIITGNLFMLLPATIKEVREHE